MKRGGILKSLYREMTIILWEEVQVFYIRLRKILSAETRCRKPTRNWIQILDEANEFRNNTIYLYKSSRIITLFERQIHHARTCRRMNNGSSSKNFGNHTHVTPLYFTKVAKVNPSFIACDLSVLDSMWRPFHEMNVAR
jgi:hypothetical protein